jgi:hypothetical protein
MATGRTPYGIPGRVLPGILFVLALAGARASAEADTCASRDLGEPQAGLEPQQDGHVATSEAHEAEPAT